MPTEPNPDPKPQTGPPGVPHNAPESVVIEFCGHPAIRGTDPRGWEILDSDEWVDRPGAIGFLPTFDPVRLREIRGGRVHARIEISDRVELLEGTLWPGWSRGQSFLFRRDTRTATRPFAVQCTKAAADLDRTFVELLQRPRARGRLILTPMRGASTGPGSLTLVAMPIGHQGDLTPRAIETLMEADLILAEDTREAEHALRWRGIRTPIVSCHEHNERSRLSEATRRLASGQRLALVSDAGTPLVSDPGYPLVQAALEAGALVTAVPGPSAVIQALVLSGLPVATFRFAGFPPRRATDLERFLGDLLVSTDTNVMFESSHRIATLIEKLATVAPNRATAICKDLTKRPEEILRGTAAEVWQRLRQLEDPGGEYCVVLAPRPPADPGSSDPETDDASGTSAIESFIAALLAAGCPTAPIARAWREVAGLERDDAYSRVQRMAQSFRSGADPGKSG